MSHDRSGPATSACGVLLHQLDWRQCQDCLAGKDNACADLLKRHEPLIARLMWRFTRDRRAQVELVHEVFVQVYLSLPRLKDRGAPLEHWLAKIATRVGYQFWKSQTRRGKIQSINDIDLPATPITDQIEPAEAADLLHKLLAILPPADRLVLTLMYFESHNIEQIASQTGWNTAMVKMRAYRARNRLRELIEQKNLTDFFSGVVHGTT